MATANSLLHLHRDQLRQLSQRRRELEASPPQADQQAKLAQVQEQQMEHLLRYDQLFQRHSLEPRRHRVIGLQQLGALRDEPETEEIQLYRLMRARLDPDYVPDTDKVVNDDNYCKNCRRFRVILQDDAVFVCEQCGSERVIPLTGERASLKDPPNETKVFDYQRVVHFLDRLDCLQAKERSLVPDEILAAIRAEAKTEKRALTDLQAADVKRYLKKRGYGSKYYDNIPQILLRIANRQPPQMTADMVSQMLMLFRSIQEPYELYKGSRRNFISYNYIIYKFCELLGYTQFLPYLKLHKDESKTHDDDQIWKQICEHLGGEEVGWAFIKTAT
jgi:hypothetical protein